MPKCLSNYIFKSFFYPTFQFFSLIFHFQTLLVVVSYSRKAYISIQTVTEISVYYTRTLLCTHLFMMSAARRCCGGAVYCKLVQAKFTQTQLFIAWLILTDWVAYINTVCVNISLTWMHHKCINKFALAICWCCIATINPKITEKLCVAEQFTSGCVDRREQNKNAN
jgi:hypothetical protein